MSDGKVKLTEVSFLGGGAISAQVAENAHHFTLADIAAILTITYTAFLFSKEVYKTLKPYLAKRGNRE